MEFPDLQIPNYQIYQIIGQGGMGTVYLGIHQQIQRKVAIKVLNPTYAIQDNFRERFKNEASVLSQLQHPNIVKLYEYVQLPQTVCLIMEYVEGIPLDEYISKVSGPIPEKKTLSIFKQIAEGLNFAHQEGIIHRDIKPANIIINDDLQCKILDFGIAKAMGSTQAKLTQVGIRLGTMMYMSPEQLRGQGLDFRSDMYSLGVTLFEMLTGKTPYQEGVSEYELIHKIVHEPLPRMVDFYPNISERLQIILDKATAKLPEQRFNTIDDFWKTLKGDLETPKIKTPQVINKDENIIEWTIKSNKIQEKQKETPKIEDPLEEENLIEETIYLENFFGKISNFQIEYFKGKDLFEVGKLEKLDWERLEKINIKTHREWLTGIIILAITLVLFSYVEGSLSWFFLVLGGFLTWLSFASYPTIIIYKTHHKKMTMRGWPWQNRAAQNYAQKVKEILEEEFSGF